MTRMKLKILVNTVCSPNWITVIMKPIPSKIISKVLFPKNKNWLFTKLKLFTLFTNVWTLDYWSHSGAILISYNVILVILILMKK